MRNTLLATAALATFMAAGAYAVTPNTGIYNRDAYGLNAPILPMEDYVNKQSVPVSGTITMTCPVGTGQFYTAAAAGADYEVRRNGGGAACPSTSSTGTAGSPRTGPRGWVSGTTDLTFCADAGTVVYLGCWLYGK